MATRSGSETREPYGFVERELIFKLLASHALVDGPFFWELRDNPRAAAEQLHISLTDADVDYIKNKVEWAVLEGEAERIRAALHLEDVTHSW